MTVQSSEGLLSPVLRRWRMSAVRPYIKGRILDVGCGSGELARIAKPDSYLGIDLDADSVDKARHSFGRYRFARELPGIDERFDTVVSLAVIEHVSDPAEFLSMLAARLATGPNASIVLTTPHPSVDWVHTVGARLGLFSRHASEEHDSLLGRAQLDAIAAECEVRMVVYRKFMFGANQLAVFRRA